MRLSMNTRYAVIHASFWGAYGSLWAFIALVLEYNGFASAQVGVVTSCATLLSVFLSPAVSSFLDARPGLENRHGAMALLTLAAALCLLVWLVPLPRPFVLGVCFALIGAFLSSTPPFQNAMAMDANRCGIPVVYGFCRGVGSVSYAAAVLLLGFVLERHAPTLLLPVFAALTACGLLAMSGFRLPERPDEAADRPAEHRSIAAVLRSHPRFALTLLGCMFFFLTHTISNTYMNALVGKAGGTASAVGTSLAISAVLELPAMTLVSRLQKRFSASPTDAPKPPCSNALKICLPIRSLRLFSGPWTPALMTVRTMAAPRNASLNGSKAYCRSRPACLRKRWPASARKGRGRHGLKAPRYAMSGLPIFWTAAKTGSGSSKRWCTSCNSLW